MNRTTASRYHLCFILSALFLVGCATVEPEVKYITVKGPTPPVIETPLKPDIPTTAGNDEKVKAIMEYILELRARLDQAINALETYR